MTKIETSQTDVDNPRTSADFGANLPHDGSRDVLEQTRRDLIVIRNKHGAMSPIGCRCSNIVER